MIAPDVTRLSPNINKEPMPRFTRTVIIHSTRSGKPMNPTEFEGTLNYMQQPGTTSSHWVVSRLGVKARVVMDDNQAWHAGNDNDNAWGIEIEQGVEDDGFTMPQMWALVDICRGYRDDFNVPVRHVHDSTSGGFVGHQETAQGRSWGKTDPGRWFNWDWFINQCQAGQIVLPVGIGVHYRGGTGEEIWTPRDGQTLDGIGLRWPDGAQTTLWTP